MMLIAGKMHAAGVLAESGENIITEEDVRAFIGAGADVVLMPAPGTVPGITTEYIRGLVSCAHSLGKLTLTAIGTSQEGADVSTIREIAPDVQDDRDGPSSSGRFRVSWHGPSGEYPGIREGDPGRAAYVSPDGVVP